MRSRPTRTVLLLTRYMFPLSISISNGNLNVESHLENTGASGELILIYVHHMAVLM
jgi:hypothetical protein